LDGREEREREKKKKGVFIPSSPSGGGWEFTRTEWRRRWFYPQRVKRGHLFLSFGSRKKGGKERVLFNFRIDEKPVARPSGRGKKKGKVIMEFR